MLCLSVWGTTRALSDVVVCSCSMCCRRRRRAGRLRCLHGCFARGTGGGSGLQMWPQRHHDPGVRAQGRSCRGGCCPAPAVPKPRRPATAKAGRRSQARLVRASAAARTARFSAMRCCVTAETRTITSVVPCSNNTLASNTHSVIGLCCLPRLQWHHAGTMFVAEHGGHDRAAGVRWAGCTYARAIVSEHCSSRYRTLRLLCWRDCCGRQRRHHEHRSHDDALAERRSMPTVLVFSVGWFLPTAVVRPMLHVAA